MLGGKGCILITGSIAGFMPGTYQAVYNATKAFLDSFSFALRQELKDTGVSVTCLIPGATETDFFERADMMDTKIGQAKKDDPAEVARLGFEAMMKGRWRSHHRLAEQAEAARTYCRRIVSAEMHGSKAEPQSAQ
jgi:short-subunit dehydrogenase